MTGPDGHHDVVIIGAGQAGLSCAYFLRRSGLDVLLLDAGDGPGGAWRHAWNSLTLFSPAAYSSLSGWLMPAVDGDGNPGRDAVIDYLTRYEARYGFRVERPVTVSDVSEEADGLAVITDHGVYRGRAVISATGTWSNPFIPDYPCRESFTGIQQHSAHYRSPDVFRNRRTIVVGGGNSGAQIVAELSEVTQVTWVTMTPPVFLPDDVDGRVLFERASARILGTETGAAPVGGLGDIVMVPPVKAARDRGALTSVRPFTRIDPDGVTWADGTSSRAEAIVWCTGFRPALDHLRGLGVVEADGTVAVDHGRSVKQKRLWLAGYGAWCGAASATLMGAARTAREHMPLLVESLEAEVHNPPSPAA